jgi:hypothetical protein
MGWRVLSYPLVDGCRNVRTFKAHRRRRHDPNGVVSGSSGSPDGRVGQEHVVRLN